MTEAWLNVRDLSSFTELVPPDCTFLIPPAPLVVVVDLHQFFFIFINDRSLQPDVYSSCELQLMHVDSVNRVLCALVY